MGPLSPGHIEHPPPDDAAKRRGESAELQLGAEGFLERPGAVPRYVAVQFRERPLLRPVKASPAEALRAVVTATDDDRAHAGRRLDQPRPGPAKEGLPQLGAASSDE